MNEADWKIFKLIKDKAIEKFCDDSLLECSEQINKSGESAHNKYLALYRLVNERDEQMAQLFDAHSRSKASMQLIAIRGQGLAEEDLLKQLSQEFFAQTDPKKYDW
jgi:pyoverdine/dityrosine biosynthesis protein Dit1